jgi:hypothetical protein
MKSSRSMRYIVIELQYIVTSKKNYVGNNILPIFYCKDWVVTNILLQGLGRDQSGINNFRI